MKKDLRGKFTTEKQLNDIMQDDWKTNGALSFDTILITKEQQEKIIASQPDELVDWETGETFPNPVKQSDKPDTAIGIYESDFGAVKVDVE